MISLRCKICGYEWLEEKKSSDSLFYCPNCGEIGRIDQFFSLTAKYEEKEDHDFSSCEASSISDELI